jgi:pilus assembly protein CpaE
VESFAATVDAPPGAAYDVAVVEPDANLRTRLAVELSGAGQFETMEDLVQRLDPARPVVAVFGPGFASPIGFQHVHRVTSSYTMLGVVFAVYELSTDVLQQALRAGARDAVVIGGEASLNQSVDRVGELLAGAVTTRVQAPAARTGEPGRLISVFSTKGGVGKTCVAINVAAAMAKRSSEPVVLIDGDLQFGDVSVMLSLQSQNTVLDAAAAVQYGDMELVQTLADKDPATGLLVLPAPIESMPPDALLPGEMVNICAALQAIAGHVVIDLPSVFNEYVLAIIEASDDVLLVGSMDIPSIKNLKIGMQQLDLRTIAGPKLKLVLNHANAKVKLDVKEIERVLGMSADFPIPDDIAVPISVNAGRPVVVDEPKAPVSRALDHIAETLLGPNTSPKKGRRGK